MTHQDKQLLSASAKKIIGLVKSKKDAEMLIADILVNCVKQGMYEERQEWIEASKTLGPKNREKLLKARKL
jgi:hypothetical protein